ncbi:hypothetical protein Fcan01_26611 [Folsomia candida]|uniref:Uncharacterized protein n=1 Tax=Folsomia candida TaxID=158441 RepID=A0A226D1E8_FOLCA|nr:hypothetical protein Fcan01_26611 [Folsomia candida]
MELPQIFFSNFILIFGETLGENNPLVECLFYHKQVGRDEVAESYITKYHSQGPSWLITWTIFNRMPTKNDKMLLQQYGVSVYTIFQVGWVPIWRRQIRFASECAIVHIYHNADNTERDLAQSFTLFYFHIHKPESIIFFYYRKYLVEHLLIYYWNQGSYAVYIVVNDNFYRFNRKGSLGMPVLERSQYSFITVIRTNPKPFPNWQGTKLYIEVLGVHRTGRPQYHNFQKAAENEISCLTNKFNFSHIYVNLNTAVRPYIQINMYRVRYDYQDLNFIGLCRTVKYYVIYCRRNEVLETTWVVWFTPFHATVWISVCLVIFVLAGSRRTGSLRDILQEIFFLVSILCRQSSRDLDSVNYLIFALLAGTILPSLYESIVTGKIISPSPPIEYLNLGEFINSSYKLIMNIDKASGINWMGIDPAIVFEFKKYAIINKINSSLDLVYTVPDNYLTQKLTNEDEPSGIVHLTESSEGLTNLELRQREISYVREHYPCSQFSHSGHYLQFIFLHVPFVKEAPKIHNSIFEIGLINQWTKTALWDVIQPDDNLSVRGNGCPKKMRPKKVPPEDCAAEENAGRRRCRSSRQASWNSRINLEFIVWRRSIPSVQHVLMEETTFRRGIIRGQDDINIQLPELVNLAGNKWVDVHFQLDGAPSEYLHQAEVYRTVLYEDKSGILFHTLTGSRQLKKIVFRVNDDNI